MDSEYSLKTVAAQFCMSLYFISRTHLCIFLRVLESLGALKIVVVNA